ncbi:prepilin-type N-terminal cleavage/methylation domain-containing protein [Congregibacter litoralis]|uniref:Prepilin-type N-terminal cleavage/methylation domain protein n=1 Tax=Congregibacter litoralis KT71 TaxID=314285 RepID=A4A5M3_9GAMM|nr:prepilin-type N-terminal cleavage/methylation domain-containing protein [Congregibacter litoralis]EAQ98320.1 prepilin-type N-terminal cleavage/methylation domain protein [Congregibacter litoralis KT71]
MRPQEGGFTLVEMMVSVTILSLVMLATVTGLRTLASTQSSLNRVTDRNDEIRSVSSFLRDALESAVVGSSSGGLTMGGGSAEMTVFEASPTQLMWKTTMMFGESTGGSFVARVAQESDDIVLRWQKMDARGQMGDWNNAAARTLVEGAQEFSVAYRRQPNGLWLSEWDGRGAPGWVRLRIRSAERYWPDIVMEVAR